jgi:2-hydroxychromene-2-carboxylate isomerase
VLGGETTSVSELSEAECTAFDRAHCAQMGTWLSDFCETGTTPGLTCARIGSPASLLRVNTCRAGIPDNPGCFSMLKIDYYFSVLSDWAYLGGERFENLARRYGAKINHMPVRLSAIYAGTGGIILQERSQQRQDYRVVELERWRDALGIPIVVHPRYYPTDDRLSSCAIIAVKKAGGCVGRFANEILKAIWADERDISNPDVLKRIADGIGLDGSAVLEVARNEEITRELEQYTTEAQRRGVFGSPFYIFENELFWGQDRLEFLEERLAKVSENSFAGRITSRMQGTGR